MTVFTPLLKHCNIRNSHIDLGKQCSDNVCVNIYVTGPWEIYPLCLAHFLTALGRSVRTRGHYILSLVLSEETVVILLCRGNITGWDPLLLMVYSHATWRTKLCDAPENHVLSFVFSQTKMQTKIRQSGRYSASVKIHVVHVYLAYL